MSNNTERLWRSLATGETNSLASARLADGRLHIDELTLSAGRIQPLTSIGGSAVSLVNDINVVRDVIWDRIAITRSSLEALRLTRCRLTDCQFVDSDLSDLRLWATTIRRCLFENSSLRGAALGGEIQGVGTEFAETRFIRADLRATAYANALFEGCEFSDCRLDGVNFVGTRFKGVRFRGEVRNVRFTGSPNRSDFEEVDFSGASLRHVEFRNLHLNRVSFPRDEKHIVFGRPADAYQNVLDRFRDDTSVEARRLSAYLRVLGKWTLADQAVGVVNLDDLVETGGLKLAFEAREVLLTSV